MEKSNDKLNSTTSKGNGMRFNSGKLRYDLIHPKAHQDFVGVLTYGANKYTIRDENENVIYDGSMNWRNGLSWTSVLASLKRHIAAIELGEDYDPESGHLHIAHAACNVHFLNAFYYIFPQGDDRVKTFLKIPKIGLDIDGVLADFMGAWHKLYPEVSSTPSSWFFDKNIKKKFDAMIQAKALDDFYLGIEPQIKAEDLPFVPHCYITSRPVAKEITEKWISIHGFPNKPVYSIDIRQSKVNVAKEAGIEFFIDDSYENFVDLNQNGIFTFLYSAPWNIKYNVGYMRIKSLKDIPILK